MVWSHMMRQRASPFEFFITCYNWTIIWRFTCMTPHMNFAIMISFESLRWKTKPKKWKNENENKLNQMIRNQKLLVRLCQQQLTKIIEIEGLFVRHNEVNIPCYKQCNSKFRFFFDDKRRQMAWAARNLTVHQVSECSASCWSEFTVLWKKREYEWMKERNFSCGF